MFWDQDTQLTEYREWVGHDEDGFPIYEACFLGPAHRSYHEYHINHDD